MKEGYKSQSSNVNIEVGKPVLSTIEKIGIQRNEVRNGIFNASTHQSPKQILLDGLKVWDEHFDNKDLLDDISVDLFDNLTATEIFLNLNPQLICLLENSNIDPQHFLSLSAANALMLKTETLLYLNNKKKNADSQLAPTKNDSRSEGQPLSPTPFRPINNTLILFSKNEVTYIYEKPVSPQRASHVINTYQAAIDLPSKEGISLVAFTPPKDKYSHGKYFRNTKTAVIYMEDAKKTQKETDRKFKTSVLTLAHELQHARQPEIFGLTQEIDAYNAEVTFTRQIVHAARSGRLSEQIPNSYIIFNDSDIIVATWKMKKLLSQINDPNPAVYLLADHNTEILRREYEELMN